MNYIKLTLKNKDKSPLIIYADKVLLKQQGWPEGQEIEYLKKLVMGFEEETGLQKKSAFSPASRAGFLITSLKVKPKEALSNELPPDDPGDIEKIEKELVLAKKGELVEAKMKSMKEKLNEELAHAKSVANDQYKENVRARREALKKEEGEVTTEKLAQIKRVEKDKYHSAMSLKKEGLVGKAREEASRFTASEEKDIVAAAQEIMAQRHQITITLELQYPSELENEKKSEQETLPPQTLLRSRSVNLDSPRPSSVEITAEDVSCDDIYKLMSDTERMETAASIAKQRQAKQEEFWAQKIKEAKENKAWGKAVLDQEGRMQEWLKRREKDPILAEVELQKESRAFLIPGDQKSSKAEERVLEQLSFLTSTFLKAEASLVRPSLIISGLQFSQKALPLQRRKKIEWKIKVEKILESATRLSASLDHAEGPVKALREKAWERIVSEAVTEKEFLAVLDQILAAYKKGLPRGMKLSQKESTPIRDSARLLYLAESVNLQRMDYRFDPNIADNLPRGFVEQFNDEFAGRVNNLKRPRVREEVQRSVKELEEEAARTLESSAQEVRQEMENYYESLSSYNRVVSALNGKVESHHENFIRRLDDLETEAKGIAQFIEGNPQGRGNVVDRLSSRSDSVTGKAEIDIYMDLLETRSSKKTLAKLKEDYQVALQNFYSSRQYSPNVMWAEEFNNDRAVQAVTRELKAYEAQFREISIQTQNQVRLQIHAQTVKELQVLSEGQLNEINQLAAEMKEEKLVEAMQGLALKMKEHVKFLSTCQDQITKAPELKEAVERCVEAIRVQPSTQEFLEDAQRLSNYNARYPEIMRLCTASETKPLPLSQAQKLTPADLNQYVELLGHCSKIHSLCTETHSKQYTIEQVKTFQDEGALDKLEGQLKLVKALEDLLRDVPFWNDQVTWITGAHIEFFDTSKQKNTKLYVPDGVGSMHAAVVKSSPALGALTKLLKVKEVAAARLEITGLRTHTRREPTHKLYTILKGVDFDNIGSLDKAVADVSNLKNERLEQKNKNKKSKSAVLTMFGVNDPGVKADSLPSPKRVNSTKRK